MYTKNREKIVQHIWTEHSFFVVNFYVNSDVKITDHRDLKGEFYFNIPRMLAPEILDAVFMEALNSYLTYWKNRGTDVII